MGNLQVRFLEGWAPAMAPGYSTSHKDEHRKGPKKRHSGEKPSNDGSERAFPNAGSWGLCRDFQSHFRNNRLGWVHNRRPVSPVIVHLSE